MASPLLEYANSRVRLRSAAVLTRDTDGRLEISDEVYYLIICYMKRAQYTGVTSGSRKIPLASELNGEMLPGASGDEFYYRGFGLQYCSISSAYDWLAADISDLTFTDLDGSETFLRPQREVDFMFGTQGSMHGTIERSSGKFGGSGIDKIIYPAIGVELQIAGAEILD